VDEASLTDRTTIDDSFFRTCLTESMMTVSFASRPPSGGLLVSLTLTYPFEPSVGDTDAG
jgi:hypothetical protein